MESSEMRVDGNAIAGALGEVFVLEMTAARIACDGCGKVESIGAEHVYMRAPGIVLRCRHCDNALLVITRADGRSVLAFSGSRWLQLGEPR
jgi:uncharacterized protein DUF6510